MNHHEKTFWEMQKRCISTAKEYALEFNKHTVIKDDIAKLISNEAELAETAKTQSTSDTEGHVNQKKNDMSSMSSAVYKLCRSMCHYAKLNNDKVLLSKVDYSESKLLSGDENEIMLRFKSILATGSENLSLLAPYSVTASALDALDLQYEKLASLPETINQVSATKKGATRDIKELNAEARIIFDRVDDAIEAIIDDEKILNAWFDSRKIKGRRIRKDDDEDTNDNNTDINNTEK
jgi:hypothetical protein